MKLIIKRIKRYYRMLTLLCEYVDDYKLYRKWNYNDISPITSEALEAKILRQTHTIEKGMSIALPRAGFGTGKINELIDMLNKYIDSGFDVTSIPFINAISVMHEYINFQKSMGYENKALFQKIYTFSNFFNPEFISGVQKISLADLKEEIRNDYMRFSQSRHSIRQYESTGVDEDQIRKAVILAMKSPTACNRQACKVYYYKDNLTNVKLGELIAGNTGFQDDIKKYLVVTANLSSFYDPFERNQLYVEGGLFALALVEALHYYGIASCILQNGELKGKKKKFIAVCGNIPENEKIVLFIAIGNYKKDVVYAVSHRKDVDTVLKIR